MPRLILRNGVYYLDYTETDPSGRQIRRRKSLNTRDKAEAERILKERQRAEARAALGIGRKAQIAPTAAEVFDAYEADELPHYSEQTGHGWLYSAGPAAREHIGGLRVPDIEMHHLRALQTAYIARGCNRRTVNEYMQRVKTVLKWGMVQGLISKDDWLALAEFPALKAGRSNAPEPEPVRPVALATTMQTADHMDDPYPTMLRLLWHTGARSGEICPVWTKYLNVSGPVWTYAPAAHKTAHKGRSRVLRFGPEAQEWIYPFLEAGMARGFLFANRHGKPVNQPGFAAYVARVNREQGIPSWHLHQIRHSVATDIRAAHGIEVASAMLDHADLTVTQIYAEKNAALLDRVAMDRRVGL